MKLIFVLICVMMLSSKATSHTLHLGRTCPDVQPFPNLSVDKILGPWFVLYKFDTDNTCLQWNFTKGVEHDTLMLNETRQLSLLDMVGVSHTHQVTATLDVPNPEVPSKMRVRWPTSLTGKADFIIFDTDYDTYMSVFECDRAGLLHRRSVTVLSRTKRIDEMFVNRVKRLLETADVRHGALDEISHAACKDTGRYNWKVDSELFGLLPHRDKENLQVSSGVENYDISQVELLGEGVEGGGSTTFRGVGQQGKPNL